MAKTPPDEIDQMIEDMEKFRILQHQYFNCPTEETLEILMAVGRKIDASPMIIYGNKEHQIIHFNKSSSKQQPMAQDLRSAAHAYLGIGLSTIPGAHNEMNVFKKFATELPTESEIDLMFMNDTGRSIAVCLGPVSGGLEMIDIKGKKLGDNEPAINQFIQRYKEILPPGVNYDEAPLLIIKSPSGGHHVYYRNLGKPNRTKKNLDTTGKYLIELRGEGTYAIVPPSPNYEAMSGSFTSIPVWTQDTVDAIHEICSDLFNTQRVVASLRRQVLDVLMDPKNKGGIYITQLHDLMPLFPGIAGNESIYMPVKEGANPNLVWLNNVSSEFSHAFSRLLLEDKAITWEAVDDIFKMIVEAPATKTPLPLARPEDITGKQERWVPITISLRAGAIPPAGFGKAVSDIRLSKEMTQEALAIATGYNVDRIKAIEQDRYAFPTRQEVHDICKGLGVSPHVLLLNSIGDEDVAPKHKELFNTIKGPLLELIGQAIGAPSPADPSEAPKKAEEENV